MKKLMTLFFVSMFAFMLTTISASAYSDSIGRMHLAPVVKHTLPNGETQILVKRIHHSNYSYEFFIPGQSKQVAPPIGNLQPAEFELKRVSVADGVKIRTTPSFNGQEGPFLALNKVVEYYGTVNKEWAIVKHASTVGYVPLQTLANMTVKTRYATSDLVVRDNASKSATALYTIPKGTEVKAFTKVAGWTFIVAGDVRGYVDAKYLSTTKLKNSVSYQSLGFNSGLVPTKKQSMPYYTSKFVTKGGAKYGYNSTSYEMYNVGYGYYENRAGFTFWTGNHNVKIDYPVRIGAKKTYTAATVYAEGDVRKKVDTTYTATVKDVAYLYRYAQDTEYGMGFKEETHEMHNVVVVELYNHYKKSTVTLYFSLNEGLQQIEY